MFLLLPCERLLGSADALARSSPTLRCFVLSVNRPWCRGLALPFSFQVLTFRVPPFYSLIVRTLTILEGLALFVDPDFRLIKVLLTLAAVVWVTMVLFVLGALCRRHCRAG